MERQSVLETNSVISGLMLIFSLVFGIDLLVKVSLALLLITVFIPRVAEVVAINWMRVIRFIGHINSKIILTVIFFVVLVPLALAARLFREDPMNLKKSNKSSYYHVLPNDSKQIDFNKMW